MLRQICHFVFILLLPASAAFGGSECDWIALAASDPAGAVELFRTQLDQTSPEARSLYQNISRKAALADAEIIQYLAGLEIGPLAGAETDAPILREYLRLQNQKIDLRIVQPADSTHVVLQFFYNMDSPSPLNHFDFRAGGKRLALIYDPSVKLNLHEAKKKTEKDYIIHLDQEQVSNLDKLTARTEKLLFEARLQNSEVDVSGGPLHPLSIPFKPDTISFLFYRGKQIGSGRFGDHRFESIWDPVSGFGVLVSPGGALGHQELSLRVPFQNMILGGTRYVNGQRRNSTVLKNLDGPAIEDRYFRFTDPIK